MIKSTEIKNVKAKIHVTKSDNEEYFNQAHPTFRYGFCFVNRTVKNIKEHCYGQTSEYSGFIARRGNSNLRVVSFDLEEWSIEREAEDGEELERSKINTQEAQEEKQLEEVENNKSYDEKKELKRYADVKREFYRIKGHTGEYLETAVKFALDSMTQELKNVADTVTYLKDENDYLESALRKTKDPRRIPKMK